MKKILFTIIVIAFTFSSCEKDDICDPNTPTTPRLVISFLDRTNSTPKNVTNLKVIGEKMTQGIIFNENAVVESDKYLTSANTISIPLKTNEDITSFRFILNANSTNLDFVNEDVIQFNYTRQNIFVSRACGYKTIFTLNRNNPFILTDSNNPEGFWIQNVFVEEPNIEFENETHIKIYF
ncbi:DUF6452 family protein [Flavobacterium sp. 140616W15]|uniref:DUF6452 family protein n=1 Tax=Flavobacterium sp. 140616W15 TaxID=2478552 RepID=UPI000F0C5EB6|nr:DUF6452 family protein [Flavobacterium sp. 140616W15]AYN03243.1 hypothetical protein EAG11_02950 [Flavobacterium sp. 140616W15]